MTETWQAKKRKNIGGICVKPQQVIQQGAKNHITTCSSDRFVLKKLMRKIFTSAQLKQIDELTVKTESIASIDLMERAARAVADEIGGRWDSTKHMVIFAGPGNNGGDALALARLLSQKGYRAETFLFNPNSKLSADCEENKERLLSSCPNAAFTEVIDKFEIPDFSPDTLIIDGLFGTGLNRPLSGGFAKLVSFINTSNCQILSIDVPSGLMSEDNSDNTPANIVKATYTFTFQFPKLSFLLDAFGPYAGNLKVLDIGLSQSATDSMPTDYYLIGLSDVAPLLLPRDEFGHKGTFGHALLIAGSYGLAGAAILASKACLRSGVGKITVHTPQMNNSILQISVPEAVMSLDVSDCVFSHSVAKPDAFDAIGIGPGIGTQGPTAMAFIDQVQRTRKPMVVDADGINIMAAHRNWINQLPQGTIITPHPGELRRLSETTNDSFSLLQSARCIAERHHIFVILKGHHSAICTPDGEVFFNNSGNSGMATAGSGDVLTGIITALLAQHYTSLHACILGVYLHGLAGDLAAKEKGQNPLIATDIIDFLPEAFKLLASKKANEQTKVQVDFLE